MVLSEKLLKEEAVAAFMIEAFDVNSSSICPRTIEFRFKLFQENDENTKFDLKKKTLTEISFTRF